MYFVPSTTITVLREGEGLDEYGDPSNARTLVDRRIPAHIYEQNQTVAIPPDNRPEIIRSTKAVIRAGENIKAGDKVTTADNKSFLVEMTQDFYNPFAKPHTELYLRQVN